MVVKIFVKSHKKNWDGKHAIKKKFEKTRVIWRKASCRGIWYEGRKASFAGKNEVGEGGWRGARPVKRVFN